MALLLIELDKRIGNAQQWRDTFAQQLPDRPVRIWPDNGDVKEIEYLAFMHPDFGKLPEFPNLKAMFSRSAGVEAFIHHPKMPKVPLGKVEPPGGDPMMTEYVIMHVLRFHREMPKYQAAQARREWMRVPIVRPEHRRVGFLGYGMMAQAPALVLKSLGFPVSAWVRSPKRDAEVTIFHGEDQLAPFLAQTDIAVCLLPLTAETRGLIDARALERMKPTAHLVNTARGPLVDHAALADALRRGVIAGAALDVTDPEPLPPDHPLLDAPNLVVVPHVGSATIEARSAMTELAVATIEAGLAGRPLPHPA